MCFDREDMTENKHLEQINQFTVAGIIHQGKVKLTSYRHALYRISVYCGCHTLPTDCFCHWLLLTKILPCRIVPAIWYNYVCVYVSVTLYVCMYVCVRMYMCVHVLYVIYTCI